MIGLIRDWIKEKPDDRLPEGMRESIVSSMAELLGGRNRLGRLVHLGSGTVVDATTKVVLYDSDGWPVAFVLCSSAASPVMVARGVAKARQARAQLGPQLGEVILEPLADGTADGLSYALFPYCRPLTQVRRLRCLQQWKMVHRMLHWLYEATAATCSQASEDLIRTRFIGPLQSLGSAESLPSEFRNLACQAIDELHSGSWHPRTVLMHGDLWWGNFLSDRQSYLAPRRPYGSHPFTIIDWAGYHEFGYPLFDLLRFLDHATKTLRCELERHCRLLSCLPAHRLFYIAAALGHIYEHIEYFPVERFTAMGHSCIAQLRTMEA